MKTDLLVSVHCYFGDMRQVEMLRIVYEHHDCKIVVVSPIDSPVYLKPYDSKQAGLREYYGQKSWDRQHDQLELLLNEYPEINWFLLNDADSFCFSPELPSYLFEDKNMVYSNEVNDFRVPGETWTDKNGSVTWPKDYHAGYGKLVAMQPPYFCSRESLQKIVDASKGMIACPITPFIDWWWIPACKLAGVNHTAFRNCVSCETETEMGLRLVASKVREGATFIHAVKRPEAFRVLCEAYWSTLK